MIQRNWYYTVVLILLAGLNNFTFSQALSIKGKVVDKSTREAVAFAHVFVDGTPIGQITNLYGDFSLEIPTALMGKKVTISCLGYITTAFNISSKNQNKPLLIELNQDVVQLDEVVVVAQRPEQLLREAYRRIPENYDLSASMLSGYYKLNSQLEDQNIRNIEAFIDTYKLPITFGQWQKKVSGDSTYLKEIRMKETDIKDWKLFNMLDWENCMCQLQHRDIVREFASYEDYFEKFIKSYKYELEPMVMINGRSTYKIKVVPKKRKKNVPWNGYLFLDEATMAFVKLDFVSSPRALKALKSKFSYMVTANLYNVKYNEGEWKESVNYKLKDGKWIFNEVNSSKHFKISSTKRGLERAPVDVFVYYRTDSIAHNVDVDDSIEFLPYRGEGWWELERILKAGYDSLFWQQYDGNKNFKNKERASDDELFSFRPPSTYQFTKKDTLQGELTPLRSSFDVGFYHLDVEVLEKEQLLKGNPQIDFKVVNPTSKIQLDLYDQMQIDSVIYQGQKLHYEREFNAVFIDFPKRLGQGSVHSVQVYFQGRPVDYEPDIPMYASFLWAIDENEQPWLQAICQGYGASGWWPNKDHLSDEPDSAAIDITVPASMSVVSNGRLRRQVKLPDNKVKYEWFVSNPINNYNITLNAGDYVNLQDEYINQKDTLSLDYYVMSYNEKQASDKLKIVKPMLASFEKYFGPYPFPEDGFKIVDTPHAMEHQSCVSVGLEYFQGDQSSFLSTDAPNFKAGNVDFSILLHESAHEWWGNSVSCTDNAELWLHEAFATYAEALFIEDHYGYEASQDYLNGMVPYIRNKQPIIGKADVNHIHYDIIDMYAKGALVLNTLRHVLDDDKLWFDLLKTIQMDFKHEVVTSDQIIDFMSQFTQRDLKPFFNQYLKQTDLPVLQLRYTSVSTGINIEYRWSTNIAGFVMDAEYELSNGTSNRIQASNEWQELQLDDLTIEDLSFNTQQYLIEVASTALVSK